MKILIGLTLFVTFLFLSGIHFYWGFGGKWGADFAVPTNENKEKMLNPGPLECFLVAFGLLSFGIFIIIKLGYLSFNLPDPLLNYGLWAISALFILRSIGEFKYVGFFKKVKNTVFGQMDTKFYSPLCLTIGLLGIFLDQLL